MIPAPFDYVRASSVDEAVAALVEAGDEAKLLAGGHSLLPLMRLRLATPAVLVDVGPVAELDYVSDRGDHVAVGALTRHHTVESNELLRREVPLLAAATSHVGDPQVRHRGTLGGAIAHGDPASDLPAVLLALDATLVVTGPEGTRTVAADDFFVGFLETVLHDGEILTEIRVPKTNGDGWSFQKFNRRAQDWAIVGVACQRRGDGVRIGLVNMDSRPVHARSAEAAVAAGAPDADAAAVADEGTAPSSDGNASSDFRRHLARVLVGRALAESAGQRS